MGRAEVFISERNLAHWQMNGISEIGQFTSVVLVQQNIMWLDVSMDNSVLLQNVNHQGNLRGNVSDLLQGQFRMLLSLLV